MALAARKYKKFRSEFMVREGKIWMAASATYRALPQKKWICIIFFSTLFTGAPQHETLHSPSAKFSLMPSRITSNFSSDGGWSFPSKARISHGTHSALTKFIISKHLSVPVALPLSRTLSLCRAICGIWKIQCELCSEGKKSKEQGICRVEGK